MRHDRTVRVLVADDSATARYHLTQALLSTPQLRVIGEARNGEEVLQLAAQLQPDVISMDIHMPRMDGLEATRRLMMQHPTPVVVVSALLEHDLDLAFQALQAGALAVVEKLPNTQHPTFAAKQQQLVKTLIAMSDVKVIRRGRTGQIAPNSVVESVNAPYPRIVPEILAIGASAGGPSALNTLLNGLPLDLRIPIVVVQHLPHEFVAGFAHWLGKSSGWRVQVVTDGADLVPGVVHLSPGTAHLRVTRTLGKLSARLIAERGDYRYQPAIDMLFESVAQSSGAASIGLILTGMGEDGANGLLAMRQAGGRTLAQDQTSAVVFGMPGAAIERGAVDEILPLSQLPAAILKYL
ncbi:MAG: chemotaxis-specific protein-glutamate methyltransferase CheB [Armatimonadetes bacterium]|nr:chemotaxis-specific protein-glutamate methyltransferase CheB [Anaerolineae bacterium]